VNVVVWVQTSIPTGSGSGRRGRIDDEEAA
jgi:hypothetical protein